MLTTTHVQQGGTALLMVLCTTANLRAATLLGCDPVGGLRPVAFVNAATHELPTWHEALLRQQAPLPGATPADARSAHCALHAPLHSIAEERLSVVPLSDGAQVLGYLVSERATEIAADQPAITLLAGLLVQWHAAIQWDGYDAVLDLVGHELRSPLLAAQLALQSTLRLVGNSPSTVTERLALVSTSIQQAQRLVQDLTHDALLRAGQFPLKLTEVDLASLTEATVAAHRVLWPRRIFTVLSEPTTHSVVADANRVRQVLDNLLTNAVRYGTDDTPIVVRIRPAGAFVQVAVHNEGPPIPAEEHARIWERFYRVPGHRTAMGLGLGLALVRQLIEQMQGTTGVVSAPQQGTTFWVMLPYSECAATASMRAATIAHVA